MPGRCGQPTGRSPDRGGARRRGGRARAQPYKEFGDLLDALDVPGRRGAQVPHLLMEAATDGEPTACHAPRAQTTGKKRLRLFTAAGCISQNRKT